MTLRETFAEPPMDSRPMVRWWWPGGDVDDDRLRREVALMHEAFFGGAEIQPFRIGLPADASPRVDDFLTPSFFAHVRTAVDAAHERGMWIDLTFGSGWPFGGPWVEPEHASMEARFTVRVVERPGNGVRLEIPRAEEGRPRAPGIFGPPRELPDGWDARLRRRERIVAVVAVRGEAPVMKDAPASRLGRARRRLVERPGRIDPSTAVVLTDRLRADATLDWDVPAGTWQVFCFAQAPAGNRVAGGVGDGPQLVVDHFRREAMDAYVAHVGGAIDTHLGRGALRAVFCDSLEVEALLYWTDGFLDLFRERRGYDLTPLLPLVMKPGEGVRFEPYEGPALYEDPDGIGPHVRHDYWRTVSDLMIEGFFTPFVGWARDHDVLARIQAHGSPADVQRIYGLADIAETENLYGRERFDFMKLAASARHVYGGRIASSESFAWPGMDYRTTPERMKRLADAMLCAGVNQIIYHGFPHEYACAPEPGWHPFASPFAFADHFNDHNPFWPYLSALNRYITRVQHVSREGITVSPVALLRTRLAYPQTPELGSEPDINTELFRAGYAFDHVNEHALDLAVVHGGRLRPPGDGAYGAIVAHDAAQLSLGTVERLASFARAGIGVVFAGARPAREPGYLDRDVRSARIAEIVADMLSLQNVAAVGSPADVPPALAGLVAPNLTYLGNPGGIRFIEKRIGDIHAFFFTNPSDEPHAVDVELPYRSAHAELWDPWTGQITGLPGAEAAGQFTRARLRLEPFGSALVVFHPDGHADRAMEWAEASSVDVRGPWSLRGTPLDDLADWCDLEEMRGFSGTATYTTELRVAREGRLVLDLGAVRDVAEVRVNGVSAGVRVCRPYRFDVTDLVVDGANAIEVDVTNVLANRLLAEGRQLGLLFAWQVQPPTPEPSGLLGPVRLIAEARVS